MSRKQYDAEIIKRAESLFKEGLGAKASAKALQIPYYTVRDWNRLYKLGRLSNIYNFAPNQHRKYNCIIIDYARMLYKSGKSFNEIAARCNVPRSTIRYWFRKRE